MTDDLSRLQADADACLRFLIDRQEEWGPVRTVATTTPPVLASVRTTLVAVPRERAS